MISEKAMFIKTPRNSSFLLATCAVAGASTCAAADFPGFDDLPLGSTFNSGDLTSSDGVGISFGGMPWLPSGMGHGTADVDLPDGCNVLHRLDLENITAKFDFAGTVGVQTDMVIQSRHNGGQINLMINGSPVAFAYDWMAYHNTWVGGVKVEILSGGYSGDCTRILLRGATEYMSIALQEGWVDAPQACSQPTYDDIATGTGYAPGDTFSTLGIPCKVTPYVNSIGTSLSGDAAIQNATWSCGEDNEVRTYSSTIDHDFTSMAGVNDMTVRVGDYGPGVNLFINGAGYWAADWRDYDGATIGGCSVTVPGSTSSGGCDVLEISGHVDTLRLGGEETAIDCIEWLTEGSGNPGPGFCLTYDEVPPMPATEFVPSDDFTTGGIGCTIGDQNFDDGTSFTDGSAFAQPSFFACGSGQELAIRACSVNHRFAETVGPMEKVSITVADHGGVLNLGINGELAIFDLYEEIDGLTIGGVTVRVTSGGGLNECTRLEFEGTLDNLLLGGGQLFIDCLEGTVVESDDPSDLNGDGAVNGQDLAVLLSAWGAQGGDITGDGATDGQDLAQLLADWR
jgi:hypothetical protein